MRIALALLLFACGAVAQDVFEPEIAAFEAQDAATPPRPGGIVFVGSSSIRMWTTLAADFPGQAVVNRGFGGSEIADATRHARRLLAPHAPRLVVLYAGDNDLGNGRTPEQVESDFRAFIAAVRAIDEGLRIAVISIKPSPARIALLARMRDANARLARVARSSRGVEYIDVFTPMLGGDGTPRPELFLDDGLHLSDAGYRLWTSTIAPFLAPKA